MEIEQNSSNKHENESNSSLYKFGDRTILA